MKVNYDNTRHFTLLQDVEYGAVFMTVNNQNALPAFYLKVNPKTFPCPAPDSECYGVCLLTGSMALFDRSREVIVMNAEVQITRK